MMNDGICLASNTTSKWYEIVWIWWKLRALNFGIFLTWDSLEHLLPVAYTLSRSQDSLVSVLQQALYLSSLVQLAVSAIVDTWKISALNQNIYKVTVESSPYHAISFPYMDCLQWTHTVTERQKAPQTPSDSNHFLFYSLKRLGLSQGS